MGFLDNLKIKSKLWLLLMLPFLGLLFFSIESIYTSYAQYDNMDKLEKIVDISEKSALLVHETQKERGMTAGYLGSAGTKFKDKLKTQREHVNQAIKNYKNSESKLDYSKYPDRFKKLIKRTILKIEGISSIRPQVDTLSIGGVKAISFYSNMNALILKSLDASVKLSDVGSITKEIAAYSAFLQSKERAGIERAVGANTLSQDSFGKGMREKFASLISAQDSYLRTFYAYASPKDIKYLENTLKNNSVDEVNRIRNTLLGTVKKYALVSEMKQLVGYGGLIHNFKNYVIRGTKKYEKKVFLQYKQLLTLTAEYQSLPYVSKTELKLIHDIEKVFKKYNDGLPAVAAAIEQNMSVKKLDKVVKVSDGPAIRALNSLNKSLFTVEPTYWFDQITKKINLLKQIDDYLAKNLTAHVTKVKSDAYSTMMLLVISTLVIVFVVIIISTAIKSRIVNALEEFKEGLNFFFAYAVREKDYMKPMVVKGTDEFAQMTIDMNVGIEKTTFIIEQDKNVVQEIDDVMQKVGNGFFTYTIHEKGATNEVESLRQNINKMLSDTKVKLDNMNLVLTQYGKGTYTYRLNEQQKIGLYGDFGTLTTGLSSLGHDVSNLLALFANAIDNLNSNTSILTSTASTISNSSNTQAASLEETAASIEEITSNIKKSSVNVSNMSTLADKLHISSQSGQKLAEQTSQSMDEIDTEVNAISEAITIIDQIAFQTNILSLNAAVEAATAGEAGKGFAVVAQEVRNLASRSAEAANEIKALVERAASKANNGKKIASDMIDGYSDLSSKINETKNIIDDVSVASKEQQSGIIQINDAINKLDHVTQQNASASNELESIAGEIEKLTNNLGSVIDGVTFNEESKKQVCDPAMISTISGYKTDHIDFKAKQFERLDSFENFTVVNHHECKMGRWMDEQERNQSEFTKSTAWNKLKVVHEKVHSGVQNYISKNSQKVSNEELSNIAKLIEEETVEVFDDLNNILTSHCKHLQ